tara:strand:+ start:315 stop:515 length:201 start_codon:yes stop_codon:yes gene_type:complete
MATTNRQLRREISKPGKIYGDINHAHDSLRVAIEKTDLLTMIDDDDSPAPFDVVADDNGFRFLSAQ